MNTEFSPRMMVHDLYRLEKERWAAHERVIQAIRYDADITPHEQEREKIKQSQQEIRSHLRQEV